MKSKVCTKCKKEFPATIEYFAVDKRIKCGLRGMCKECERQYRLENKQRIAECNKQYTLENKQRMAEYQKRYYEENKQRMAEYQKRYYEENKQRMAEQRREYREENKDKMKEYREENRERIAEQRREYRKENRERIAEYNKQYREENKEYFRQHKRKHRIENREYYRSYEQKRNSLKKNLPATLTINQWRHARLYFNDGCAYCGRKRKLEQDHFWPLSLGGGYTAMNIIPACGSCNSSKSNEPFEEWYPTYEHYSPEREAKIYQYFEQQALLNNRR